MDLCNHFSRSLACATLVGAWLVIGSAALASDWPQFKRDAARTGAAPDEVLEFPMQRVIAVRFPAPIYASPAVVSGKVYVQDIRGHVACVDGATGKVLWITVIGGVANHSSPAVADGKVFVGSSAGHLAILEARDGKLLRKVPGKGGVVAAPALANGHVYFTALDGALTKIDYSGRVVWTFAEATGSFLDFAVRGDDILFFGRSEKVAPPHRENSVRLFHLRDEGKSVKLLTSRWAQTYPTSGLVFAEKDRCGYQIWRAEEGGNIVEVWDESLKAAVYEWGASGDNPDSRVIPSYRDGRFFFTTRTRIFSLNGKPPTSHKGIVWQSGERRSGINSSPAFGKEYLAIGTDEGFLDFYSLDAKRDAPKAAWSFAISTVGKVNGGIVSSPAISGGRAYFGGEDGILYGLGKGAEVAVIDAMKPGKPYGWPGSQLQGPEWVT